MYQLDPEAEIPVPDDNSLYPYINNDIEYRLFEDIVDSYYLDSQIKDDFHCDQDCYTATGTYCKAQLCCALLGYPFHNTAARTEAMPTREGI